MLLFLPFLILATLLPTSGLLYMLFPLPGMPSLPFCLVNFSKDHFLQEAFLDLPGPKDFL